MDPAARQKADIKVVLLGDMAVGKTALINRYIQGKFVQSSNTVGASFFLRKWGPYNIAIWDTAGEEKFTGLSSFYCRAASAAILSFDITNSKSFDLLSTRFLPLLASAKENCLKVVVGTKLDLVKSETREITEDHGQRLALVINKDVSLSVLKQVPYFETSSKTGQNVNEMFDYIFQYFFPHTGEQMKHNLTSNTIQLTNSKSKESNCCN